MLPFLFQLKVRLPKYRKNNIPILHLDGLQVIYFVFVGKNIEQIIGMCVEVRYVLLFDFQTSRA